MNRDLAPIILASQSAGRRQLLSRAGIAFDICPADIDEADIKRKLLSKGEQAQQIALALAEEKARSISAEQIGALVLGSDQLLVGPNAVLLSKAKTKAEALATLNMLSGKTHYLISAVAACRDGKIVWRYADIAKLTMKALPKEQISQYIDEYWDQIKYCVGCYRIEAEGKALFTKIEGEQSTIVGMPMPALLDYLSSQGYEPTI